MPNHISELLPVISMTLSNQSSLQAWVRKLNEKCCGVYALPCGQIENDIRDAVNLFLPEIIVPDRSEIACKGPEQCSRASLLTPLAFSHIIIPCTD